MASEEELERNNSRLPHKMELVDQGNIEMYETRGETGTKVEKKSQLERLTPDTPFYREELLDNEGGGGPEVSSFVSSDDFYKRLHDLADTVHREVNERRNNQAPSVQPPSIPLGDHSDVVKEDDEMAVKIRKAIIKMKRLDNRLTELAKKEKELKRQKMTLEDINGEYNQDSNDVIPLFKTQPHEKDDLSIECLETHTPEQELESESETTPDDEKVDKQYKGPLPRFISRNKELAAQASEVIAMTESERKHLEKLLEEEKGEEEEEEEEELGYAYSQKDLAQLTEIDSKLDSLVPAVSKSVNNEDSLLKKVSYGEKVLLELHETRSELNRLAEIDKQLENMKDKLQDKETEEECMSLTEEQVQYLIKQTLMEQNLSSPLEQIIDN